MVRHRMTAAGCRREVFADDGLLLISKSHRRHHAPHRRARDAMFGDGGERQSNLVDATLPKPPSAIVRRPCYEPYHSSGALSRRAALRLASIRRFQYAMADRSALDRTGGRNHRWQSEKLQNLVGAEMAVAVASGSTCLQTFAVSSPGPVLLYAAEDSESALRLRLESLAQHHRLQLAYLDIRVITADSLRLDASPIKSGSRPRLRFTARFFSSSIPWSGFMRSMKTRPVRSLHCSLPPRSTA